jgi:dUTP pyrophosphatase
VGLIRDRVGVLTEMNVHTSAGTFDSAFRGEVSIIMTNFGTENVEIEKGMRIAQLIVLPVVKVKVQKVDSLGKTKRGEKSFGSTGIKNLIKELDSLEKLAKKK